MRGHMPGCVQGARRIRDRYLRRGWRSSAACRQLWAARRWLTGSVHPPRAYPPDRRRLRLRHGSAPRPPSGICIGFWRLGLAYVFPSCPDGVALSAGCGCLARVAPVRVARTASRTLETETRVRSRVWIRTALTHASPRGQGHLGLALGSRGRFVAVQGGKASWFAGAGTATVTIYQSANVAKRSEAWCRGPNCTLRTRSCTP